MPLHLLGKKSWNVYNPDNVAKVRRDEAEAEAREATRERQSQDDDADKRLRLLRGEVDTNPQGQIVAIKQDGLVDSRQRRVQQRKLPGEDDTDRDIRLAQRLEVTARGNSRNNHDEKIIDGNGHISLVPSNAKLNTDRAKEKNDSQLSQDKDQSGVPLAEVLGRNPESPWYTSLDHSVNRPGTTDRDVWGNEDPRRKVRSEQRLAVDDPLAAMKKGIKQLRDAESERNKWRQQREKDLNEVEELAKRERRHKRRSSSIEPLDLDVDSLDKPRKSTLERQHRHKHRSRSRSPNDRHRRRHHHRHRHHHVSREAGERQAVT